MAWCKFCVITINYKTSSYLLTLSVRNSLEFSARGMTFWIFNSVTNFHWVSGLSPVALIFLPIANLLLNGWIGSTTGYFTCNNKAPSNISSSNRCLAYVTGFNKVHLLTVLGVTSPLSLGCLCLKVCLQYWNSKLLETSLHVDLASHNNSLDIKDHFHMNLHIQLHAYLYWVVLFSKVYVQILWNNSHMGSQY